jgi:hypothetical protein
MARTALACSVVDGKKRMAPAEELAVGNRHDTE